MKTLRLCSCLQEHGMHPVLKKIYHVYTLSSHFFNINFNIYPHIMLISTKLSFIMRLCRLCKVCKYLSSHAGTCVHVSGYFNQSQGVSAWILHLPATHNGRTQEWRIFPLAVSCLLHAKSWETLKNIFANLCGHTLRADNSECHFTCRAIYFHAKLSIKRRSLLVVTKIFTAQFYITLNNILFPRTYFP